MLRDYADDRHDGAGDSDAAEKLPPAHAGRGEAFHMTMVIDRPGPGRARRQVTRNPVTSYTSERLLIVTMLDASEPG